MLTGLLVDLSIGFGAFDVAINVKYSPDSCACMLDGLQIKNILSHYSCSGQTIASESLSVRLHEGNADEKALGTLSSNIPISAALT